MGDALVLSVHIHSTIAYECRWSFPPSPPLVATTSQSNNVSAAAAVSEASSTSSEVRILDDVENHVTTLRIARITSSQCGEYMLTVENAHGRCRAATNVSVLSEPGAPLKLTYYRNDRSNDAGERGIGNSISSTRSGRGRRGAEPLSIRLRWRPPLLQGGSSALRYCVECCSDENQSERKEHEMIISALFSKRFAL